MMAHEWIFLRPIDRVYFGSPRIQTAGEVHGGRSEFPPSPYAVAGMLRTHLLEGADPKLCLDDWSSAERQRRAVLVGTAERLPPAWQLLGAFPACEVGDGPAMLEPWLPLPAWVKYGTDGLLHPHRFLGFRGASLKMDEARWCLSPLADDDFQLNSLGCWVGTPRVAAAEQVPTWAPASVVERLLRSTEPLDVAGEAWLVQWLERWQNPRPTDSLVVTEPPFVTREVAPGVGIDSKSGTAQDSMLYALEMLRFAPGSGLLVSVAAPVQAPLRLASLDRGVGRAGRKGQTAAFESAAGRVDRSWEALLDIEHLVGDSKAGAGAGEDATAEATFWIYLGTPARMSEPYDGVLSALRQHAPPGVSVALLAVATAEPLVIGGMAMDGGRPRDNLRFARAGSGWLVRLEGGSPDDRMALLQKLHGHATLGPAEERAFGFGLTLVGRGPRIPQPTALFDTGSSAEERS